METDTIESNKFESSDKCKTKQVFIVGSRRSGTTWTLWLLANHPSIVGVQHTNLIAAYKSFEDWWLCEDRYRNSIVSGKEEKNRANLKDFLEKEEFYEKSRSFIESLFEKAFVVKPEATVLVESQPENIDNLEMLVKLFPDAYFLNVVRDPRSVFSSWKTIANTWSSSKVFHTHPVDFCERWQQDISTGKEFSTKVKNYSEVKYEDLQNNGKKEIQKLYDWLDVESSEVLVQSSIDACELQKLRKKANMPQGFFRKGKQDSWKRELSSSEIRTIEYLLAEEFESLGYERSHADNDSAHVTLRLYLAKRNTLKWLRSTFIFRMLRKLNSRILADYD